MKYCPKCGENLVLATFEGKEYQCCPNTKCQYVFWNNPLPVVAGVIETEQGIVLAHNKKWPKTIYSVITGFLESSESPVAAIQRETREELGLIPEEPRIIGAYNFEKKNQVIIAYHLTASGEIQLNHELDDFKILTRKQLSTYNFMPLYITQQIINDWIKLQ